MLGIHSTIPSKNNNNNNIINNNNCTAHTAPLWTLLATMAWAPLSQRNLPISFIGKVDKAVRRTGRAIVEMDFLGVSERCSHGCLASHGFLRYNDTIWCYDKRINNVEKNVDPLSCCIILSLISALTRADVLFRDTDPACRSPGSPTVALVKTGTTDRLTSENEQNGLPDMVNVPGETEVQVLAHGHMWLKLTWCQRPEAWQACFRFHATHGVKIAPLVIPSLRLIGEKQNMDFHRFPITSTNETEQPITKQPINYQLLFYTMAFETDLPQPSAFEPQLELVPPVPVRGTGRTLRARTNTFRLPAELDRRVRAQGGPSFHLFPKRLVERS